MVLGELRKEDKENEPVTSLFLSSEETKKSLFLCLLSAICALFFFHNVKYEFMSQKIYILKEHLVTSSGYL